MDRGRDGHGVGVAFLVHGDLDGFVAVDPHDAVAFFVALVDRRHVLETQYAALVLEDDGVAYVVDGLELVDGAHQELLAARRQTPTGEVDVGCLQTLPQRLHAHAELGESFLVDIHRDLVLEAAADEHRGDADYRIESLLDDVFGEPA